MPSATRHGGVSVALGDKRSGDVLVKRLALRPLLVGGDRVQAEELASVDSQGEQLVVLFALKLKCVDEAAVSFAGAGTQQLRVAALGELGADRVQVAQRGDRRRRRHR